MSRTNYGDPVAHYIRGVYDEYMSRWSHGRERDASGKLEPRTEVPGLSIPAVTESEIQKKISESAQAKDTADLVQISAQHHVEVPAAVVEEALQRLSTGDQNDSTSVPYQSGEARPGNVLGPTDQDMPQSIAPARSTESPLSSVDERRFTSPRTDRRCDTCWRDSIPCQHDETETMTRIEYLRAQHSHAQKHRRTRSQRSITASSNAATQLVEQQRRETRTRDRQQKEREAQKVNDESIKRKERLAKRQRVRDEVESQSPVLVSESEEEVIQWSSRRKAPPDPIVTKPLKHFRMGSDEIVALTSTPTLTPSNLRRNTAVPRTPVADPEAEERARIKRKEEREAAERAIAEQQAAEMRAKEANIRKCYYCWHYSQPCNLKMKPKCIPCHKNRRSCFGTYTRPEFCDAYKERTGKVHKQAEKDIVKTRPQMKRKGHYNGGRKISANPQPQRFFLNDNKLKCYRCWDRNLSCDLDTPKCASCVKGRAACFGFKSSRQEFCEMFEEETGEKHRWAAFFESGGIQTTPPPSATTPSKRRPRKAAREEETSESEEAWDSNDNESDDDHDDDMGNESDD